MRRKLKEDAVGALAEKLGRARAVLVTDYRGLNVASLTELRRKLREAGTEYKVAKNTLLCLAVRRVGVETLEDLLTGPTGVVFSYGDPAVAAKVLSDFARDHKELELKGGLLGHVPMDEGRIRMLAELPPREVLLARVAGGFQAPLCGLVNVLSGTVRGLVVALEAIRSQKEKAGSAPAIEEAT
ncbi:MAG: 50S ribosomal protein L10 [Firmicutes bacterium]|nr:50S ribosomal protein L10 [Bacillota bacterium]